MADIDIVPKERSYTWLWVVLALVILAVVWYMVSAGGSDQPRGMGLRELVTPSMAAAPVDGSIRVA